MFKKIHGWTKSALIHWQFYRCIVCQAPSDSARDLCSLCLPLFPACEPACTHCAEPLPNITEPLLCGNCLSKPSAFDRIQALWRYEGIVPHFIGQLKFHQKLAVARVFGGLLASAIHKYYKETAIYPEVILPVPLHKARLRKRGFNQAVELARPVATLLKRPLLKDHCIRVLNTREQAKLPLTEREQNLKDAFILAKPLPARHVLVIDDVVTTTQTVHALSTTLKKHGVSRVDVWCCARTPLRSSN